MESRKEEVIDWKLECKKLLFQRCIKSMVLSIVMQMKLVFLFAVLLNFYIFEPFSSLWQTKRFLFYFSTWFTLLLLLAASVSYFIFLQKFNLSPKVYYPTRAAWWIGNFLPKATIFSLSLAVSFLTVVHISIYLHPDYKNLLMECYDNYCLNSYYFCIMCSALFASCFYFFSNNANKQQNLMFPIIQERKLVQVRSLLTFRATMVFHDTLIPYVSFVLSYFAFGWYVCQKVADFLGIEKDNHLGFGFELFTNIRLLLYTYIVIAMVLTNLDLMQKFVSILLAEEVDFEINCSRMEHAPNGIGLVNALAMEEFPIMQNLAAWNLYNLSRSKNSEKRKEIFALTLPGGHPLNWNTLSTTILKIIERFTKDLDEATDKNRIARGNWYQPQNLTIEDLNEQKNNLRILNKRNGIRTLTETPPNSTATSPSSSPGFVSKAKPFFKKSPISPTSPGSPFTSFSFKAHQAFNESMGLGRGTYGVDPSKLLFREQDNCEENLDTEQQTFFKKFYKNWLDIRQRFLNEFPGIQFWFGEKEFSKLNYLLTNSEMVIWLLQGLSGICAASKLEDRYGVVQCNLPQIISAILKLKQELEKLQNLQLIGKDIKNHRLLTQAVKRSLYKICEAFGEYMNDLVTDPMEMRQIQSFLTFQEL